MKDRYLKINILALLLVIAAPTMAIEFRNGLYMGAALGAGFGHAAWDGTSSVTGINDQGTPLFISESWTPDGEATTTQLAGRVAFGYQLLYKSLYLAGELGGSFSGKYNFNDEEDKTFTASAITFGAPQTLDVNAMLNNSVTLGSMEFNADLKSGWLVKNNFLVYARVGLALNDLTMNNAGTWTNISTSYPPFDPPYTLSVMDTASVSESVYGIRLGLGTEYLITEYLGITLDYIYTDYGSITMTTAADGNTFLDFIMNPNISPYYAIFGIDAPDVSIATQTWMAGLFYHW